MFNKRMYINDLFFRRLAYLFDVLQMFLQLFKRNAKIKTGNSEMYLMEVYILRRTFLRQNIGLQIYKFDVVGVK